MSEDETNKILDDMWEKVKPDRRYPTGEKMPNTQWCKGAQWAIEHMRLAISGRALASALQLKIKEKSQ